MNMKIVTNGFGLYAIRKGIWPFYRYFDLKNPGFWWSKKQIFYLDCWSKEDKVKAYFGLLNPKIAIQEDKKLKSEKETND